MQKMVGDGLLLVNEERADTLGAPAPRLALEIGPEVPVKQVPSLPLQLAPVVQHYDREAPQASDEMNWTNHKRYGKPIGSMSAMSGLCWLSRGHCISKSIREHCFTQQPRSL